MIYPICSCVVSLIYHSENPLKSFKMLVLNTNRACAMSGVFLVCLRAQYFPEIFCLATTMFVQRIFAINWWVVWLKSTWKLNETNVPTIWLVQMRFRSCTFAFHLDELRVDTITLLWKLIFCARLPDMIPTWILHIVLKCNPWWWFAEVSFDSLRDTSFHHSCLCDSIAEGGGRSFTLFAPMPSTFWRLHAAVRPIRNALFVGEWDKALEEATTNCLDEEEGEIVVGEMWRGKREGDTQAEWWRLVPGKSEQLWTRPGILE